MPVIEYDEVVGVYSAERPIRLDIGTYAMKKNTPASHNSWATRLVVRRLDGESDGPVDSEHLVGIFSEDGKYRLDIGSRAVKKETASTYNSWATRLRIRPVDGTPTGNLMYGTRVGIFSEDGKYRLDIGTDATKENVPASHESWATRFHIEGSDPVVDFEIEEIEYALGRAEILDSGTPTIDSVPIFNDTDVAQEPQGFTRSVQIQETRGWSDTLGVKVGVETEFKVGVPLLAEGKIKVSAELSNSYTWNGSTTETRTYTYTVGAIVPARSMVTAVISYKQMTLRVPYTIRGDYVMKSGRRKRAEISGEYNGTQASELRIRYIQRELATGEAMSFPAQTVQQLTT